MNIVPDVVDAQLRLQLLRVGRDEMLPSVMASDPAHDPNMIFPVEALKKPHVLRLSTYKPAFRAIQKQREHERLVSNLLRLKRNARRPENSLLQLRECYPRRFRANPPVVPAFGRGCPQWPGARGYVLGHCGRCRRPTQLFP